MDMLLPIASAKDPIALFGEWFEEAAATEAGLPEAMSLATATKDGRPSVRMVLLKNYSVDGFIFYTNTNSRKGRELAENPFGALCFHWKVLSRQVRIDGPLTPVSDAEADAYFASRPRDSQLAAWASDQSDILETRDVLAERFKAAQHDYAGGPVPRPPYWSGYRLRPETIEFWQNVPNRLHDRLVFTSTGDDWRSFRIYP